MKLIALPTQFDVTDPQLAELNIGGQKIEDGVLYVNPESIDVMNEATDINETTISISGYLIRICMPIREVALKLGIELVK